MLDFEALTVMTVKSMVFWTVMLCSLEKAQCFGVSHLYFQGHRISQAKKLIGVSGFSLLPASANFLFGLLFDLADEDIFVGNVGLLLNYILN